jgi:hypothetical protein
MGRVSGVAAAVTKSNAHFEQGVYKNRPLFDY